MKFKWIIGLLFVAAFASTSAWAQTQQQLFEGEINTVHDVPINPPAGLSQTELAWYAWRLFAAVNQGTHATVADGSAREKPATTFLSTGLQPGPLPNPTIFEALYHRTEAYPAYAEGGKQPSPLTKAPVYRFKKINGYPFNVKGPNANYVNLDETNQIGQNYIFYRLSGSPNFPILFMAKVNNLEVNYVLKQKGKSPSTSDPWVFDDNTLEIKSAWRLVSDIVKSDPSSYHQATATWYEGVEDEVPEIKTGTFALVALHIIQKSANYPYFMFTTFEHVNAVTRASGTIVDPRYELTYNKLAYDKGTGDNPTASFQGAYAINAPNLPPAVDMITENFVLPPAGPAPNAVHPPGDIEDAPYTDPEGESIPGHYKYAYQGKLISAEVNDVNNLVGPMLNGGVWQNYRLKGVQAIPTSDQTTLDYYLANIVVETSQPGVQLFHGGIQGPGDNKFENKRSDNNVTTGPITAMSKPNVNMGGCMGCHGSGSQMYGYDFSFLPPSPLYQGKSVDSVPPADVSVADMIAHKRAMAVKKSNMFNPYQ